MMSLPRPLDPVRSIKVKLGIVVVASGAAGMAYFRYKIGWMPPTTSVASIGLALLTSQILAHGMTSPLREMTAAARAMAQGDYRRRVRATSRDEVGELGRAFNQMAADLSAADRQRRELIANVSHELRTPITALQGVLENLVDGVSAPDPGTLRAALAQTERLSLLITELLDLSRIDAGVVPLDRREFEVRPFLDEAVEEATMTAAGAGQPVTFRVDSSDIHGYGDRERLRQVLANLLDNAARHSPPGGTVTVSAMSAGPAGLAVEVTDEGPGIPVEERERVFERFTRGGRASVQDGGTGLGLAIAHWVVSLHGGTIAVVDGPAVAGSSVTGALEPAPDASGGSDRSGPSRPGCRIRVTLPAAAPA